MHTAAACSAAARAGPDPPAPAGWPPAWPVWLRLGTAAGPAPGPPHPASTSAPASAALAHLLFLIWTSRIGPPWAGPGRDQLYSPAGDTGATESGRAGLAAAGSAGTATAMTCATAAATRGPPGGVCYPRVTSAEALWRRAGAGGGRSEGAGRPDRGGPA